MTEVAQRTEVEKRNGGLLKRVWQIVSVLSICAGILSVSRLTSIALHVNWVLPLRLMLEWYNGFLVQVFAPVEPGIRAAIKSCSAWLHISLKLVPTWRHGVVLSSIFVFPIIMTLVRQTRVHREDWTIVYILVPALLVVWVGLCAIYALGDNPATPAAKFALISLVSICALWVSNLVFTVVYAFDLARRKNKPFMYIWRNNYAISMGRVLSVRLLVLTIGSVAFVALNAGLENFI